MRIDVGEMAALIPMLVITAAGCLALLLDTLAKRREPHIYVANWFFAAFIITVAVLHIVNSAEIPVTLTKSYSAYAGTVDAMVQWWYGHNAVGFFLTALFLASALVTLMMAGPFMREHDFEHGEHHALVLFAVAGMMTVVHATHLLSLLLGIETMSLAAYLLVACWRRQSIGAEGALKYLLLGAFAAGFRRED